MVGLTHQTLIIKPFSVTPAKAGVQKTHINKIKEVWIPAFAGMTMTFHTASLVGMTIVASG